MYIFFHTCKEKSKKKISKELKKTDVDIAATKIQAGFRGHRVRQQQHHKQFQVHSANYIYTHKIYII